MLTLSIAVATVSVNMFTLSVAVGIIDPIWGKMSANY